MNPTPEAKAEERLDQLFLTAFGTNEPAMLDWVQIKMKLKRLTTHAEEARRAEEDRCAKAIDDYVKNHATHILHYHDKEGRTTDELVFHKARFGQLSAAIRSKASGGKERK